MQDAQAARDVKKEIDILKKCHSPNIVNYFGCINKDKGTQNLSSSGFQLPEEKQNELWVLFIAVVTDLTDSYGLLCCWLRKGFHYQ